MTIAHASSRMRRGYVATRHGLVHLRHAGHGPPVVLLHDSPRSSRLHEPLLAALADRFTLIALDTPGYGNSAPLRRDDALTIADFADALAETLATLGLARVPIYGFHTSSKIALEYARRHPEQTGALILEGLSLPDEPTPEDFIARYMAPFKASDDGGYLAAQWTKIRDMHRFFPWFDLRAGTRMAMDMPSNAQLHDYSLDLFSAADHFADAYAAAMRYRAAPAIAGLRTPVVFCARPSDVLHGYLEALPQPLPTGCRVESLPDAHQEWLGRLAELFAASHGPGPAPGFTLPDTLADTRHPVHGYRELAHGQVHLRFCRGSGSAAPILLLHDLPGAASQLDGLFDALAAAGRSVVLPELPGSGDSDPLATGADASAYAVVLRQLGDALGIDAFEVYASAGSAGLALQLACDQPPRVQRLTFEALPWLDAARREATAERIAPAIEPRADGAHLLTAWHLLRDQQMAWPWYDTTAAAIRGITPQVAAADLHPALLAMLKQLPHYGEAARASLRADIIGLLPRLAMPVMLLERAGDARCAQAHEAKSLASGLLIRSVGPGISELAALLLSNETGRA